MVQRHHAGAAYGPETEFESVQLAGAQRGEGLLGRVGEEDVQRGRLLVVGLLGNRSPPVARTRAKASAAGVHFWPPVGAVREAMACSSVRRVRRWR
ncbi:hypothetical protein [Kitasatospora sp. NPDC059462]|uniref:hypothetical protein n=1 Tax=Kitasatospora sp. NPDC059462 TaxID=3346841 RepID=UPI0036A30199